MNKTVNGYEIKTLSHVSQGSEVERYFLAKPNSPILPKQYKTFAAAVAAAKSLPTCYLFMLPSGSRIALTKSEADRHPSASVFC